jgi:hypothetical protein
MAWRNGMKFPVSARVRAARGYESKDAGERVVVLRGNDPNVLALAGLASPDPNVLTALGRRCSLR